MRLGAWGPYAFHKQQYFFETTAPGPSRNNSFLTKVQLGKEVSRDLRCVPPILNILKPAFHGLLMLRDLGMVSG